MTFNLYKSNKIQRIVSFRTNISNIRDYCDFFKKGIISPRTLTIEYLDGNYHHNNQARAKMQQRLVKVLKRAKPIKSLQLHNCVVQYENISDPILIQLAKRTSRVKSLSLPDYALSQEIIQKYTLWLKYTKGVRKFDYVAPPCVDFPNGCVRKFETNVQKFLHEIRRDRLSSVNISHSTPDDKLGNSFLMFNKYPSTLKSLTFDWRHYCTDAEVEIPKLENSLRHMRELTSLSLSFRNQINLIDPILYSIQNVSQLTSLKIEFLENIDQEIDLPLWRLRSLSNLHDLTLKFGYWPKGLETFLKTIHSCPLKFLYIDAIIDQENQFDSLKELIANLKTLETLKLKVYKDSPFESESNIRSIFEKIGQIKPLKNLKLYFKASSALTSSTFNIVSALKNIFAKSVKLQKFALRFNQTDTQKAFPELLSLVTRVAPTLKKLEIDIGEFKVQDSDFKQIMNLINRVKGIQVLKLNSLCVVMSQAVEDLINSLYSLKSLQTLELREVKGSLNKPSLFVSLVEKIVSKRGLKKFDCELSWDSKDNAAVRRARTTSQIDLKKVIQKNPNLENYPHTRGMYVYYDDNIEWKW